MSPLIKNTLVFGGLILIGGFGYYLFVMQGDADLSATTVSTNEAQLANQQFLRDLREVKRLNLDTEFFTDGRVRSLVDFTEPVESEPIGRPNPFTREQ